jgi:hypothetical protein
MKSYSSWTGSDGKGRTLVEGVERPRTLNGKHMIDTEVLLWTIQAETWEEASAIHFLRIGHGGYQPHGDVKPCPKCSAMYYPEGSGDCWRCGIKV